MYYCIQCQKKTEKDKEQEFQFECSNCGQVESLFKMNEEDTSILKGKVIKEIYR